MPRNENTESISSHSKDVAYLITKFNTDIEKIGHSTAIRNSLAHRVAISRNYIIEDSVTASAFIKIFPESFKRESKMITKDLTHVYHTVKPRVLWQILFNIYKEEGGDISNLDNLLIDHSNCISLFNSMPIGESKKIVWAFEKHGETEWHAGKVSCDFEQFCYRVYTITVSELEIKIEKGIK